MTLLKQFFFAMFSLCLINNALARTITIWAWDNNFNVPIMNEAIARYQRQWPNADIQVIEKSKDDIEALLWQDLSEGNTRTLPDIVLIEDYLAPKYLQNFKRHFVNLSNDIDYSDFAEYKTSLMTIGDEIFGIPFDSGVTGMFFRADIFGNIGIRSDAFDNISWDDFIAIGQELKEKTGLYMLSSTPVESGLIRLMLQSGNAWFNDAQNNLTLRDNKALVETLNTIRKLYDSGILLQTNSWDEWVESFQQEKVATVISGVWLTGTIQATGQHAGKWMIAPIPRLNLPGARNASNLGGSSWYVINKGYSAEPAVKFLKDIFAQDDMFYQKILRKYGALATYRPSQSGTSYTKDYTFFVHQQIYQLFTQWMRNVPNIAYGQATYDINEAVAKAFYADTQGYRDLSVDKVLRDAENQLLNASLARQ